MKKIENLENLRVFCEIVETGSAREACEKLHIEPSNAFRIIRAMEKELKSKFFDRSQRPMKLTPEGPSATTATSSESCSLRKSSRKN